MKDSRKDVAEKPDDFGDAPAEEVEEHGAEENRAGHGGVIGDVKAYAKDPRGQDNHERRKAGGEGDRSGSISHNDDDGDGDVKRGGD